MGFLRIKKIKGNKYVYLSENRWMKRNNKVKQTSKKYLGRLYEIKPVKDVDFFDHIKIKEKDKEKYFKDNYKEEIIYDVIKWELFKHGFYEKRNVFRKDKLYVNLRLKQVLADKSKAAIGMNQGFLSGYTMSRLTRYKAHVQEDAYELAKMFVEAGLNVPKEVFINVFSKHNVSEYE